MILNELLTKLNVITKIALKDGDDELSKELKVKIMRIRLAYSKIKKAFDEESQEFAKELIPVELQELNSIERTEEQEIRFNELNDKVNAEYQEFLTQKGNEQVTEVINDKFTEEEFDEILRVNIGSDVEINGNVISIADFLEVVYALFVA